MMWWLVALVSAGYLLVSVGRTWWRERARTEHVRGVEWARTLEAAAEAGWPPYTPSGLRERDELAWREAWLRTAPHCRLHEWPDGSLEWLYVQPGREKR